MVRRFLRIAAATTVAAAAFASTPSCADNHESIFIRGVLKVSAPDCTAKADAGATLLSAGLLDVALTNSYGNFLLVGSQLIARGNPSNVRAEPNRVQMTGADITITTLDNISIPAFSVPVSGLIDPTNTADPSYGAVYVQLIPPSVGQQLGAGLKANANRTALVTVKVYGQTLGLTDVESGDFTFLVNITNGGTIVYPVDKTTGKVTCTTIPTDITFTTSCAIGNDAPSVPCFELCQVNPNAGTFCQP
jgi:hypothetical protein